MKKLMILAAAFAAILPVSCNKEIDNMESVEPQGNVVKVRMNATAGDPDSKMVLDGKQFEWKSGDQLKFRYSNGTYDDTTPHGVLTTTSNGSSVMFEGELTGLGNAVSNMYIFYSNDGAFTGAAQYYKDLSSEQTGLAEDLDDHMLWHAWVTTSMVETEKDADGNIVAIDFDANMIPEFGVVKLNVPEELGLTSIKMEADSYIAGRTVIFGARRPNATQGQVGVSCHLYRPSGDDITQSKTITISRSGAVISGDVYIVVLPDIFDPNATPTSSSYDKYCCSTKSLKFTFTNENGSVEYEKYLADPIHCGELKDLGTLPVHMMTSLCLTDATNLNLNISNPVSSYKYYYEVAATEEDCADPTTSSTEIDLSKGFSPELTGTFNRYFIKVLAHSENSSRIIKASLRNWSLNQDSPAAAILTAAQAGEKLTAVGDSETTSDGLEIRRNLTTADLSYEQTTARIALISARMQINAFLEYDSDAWISFYIDKNTCVGVGAQRGYRLFYNTSQSTGDYWSETVKSTMTEEDKSNEKYTMCLHLSDIFSENGIKAGDRFGLRGDGKHVFYGIALLEVL